MWLNSVNEFDERKYGLKKSQKGKQSGAQAGEKLAVVNIHTDILSKDIENL